jgi:hypothetical protein
MTASARHAAAVHTDAERQLRLLLLLLLALLPPPALLTTQSLLVKRLG